jgi:enediyne biosynthesis protein E4
MGVAIGDYDNAGRFGVWVTNFSEEYNALYKNDGDHFIDMSFRSKTAAPSLPYVAWGNAFFDYDNDGRLDLIAVNGHVYPQLDSARLRGSAGYRQRKLLFHGRADGTFDEVGAQYGAPLTEERVSRGLAVGDVDNDGRLDVVINDLDGPPQLLHNEFPATGNWLIVDLQGRGMNTGAIGAVVTARTGATVQRRLVQSGSSYISQEDKRLHFGLGSAAQADAVDVAWPDGTTTTLQNVKAGQILRVKQDAGR